ncbi:MAG: nitroreductase family protein [Methanobacterium sp.]
MKKDDYYPIIFKRKSIRNYDLNPLDNNKLKDISEEVDNLIPLYSNIKTEIKIISTEDVKQRFMKKAPHYLAVFSDTSEGYLTNVGFMLQQMDLFFSSNGIGSCWQGIPIPKAEILNGSHLKFIILMAFGKPLDPLYRDNIDEFKRNPIEKISNVNGADNLVEAARLAPSATNSQPWFFTGNDTTIHVYSIKPNFLKAMVVNKYIPIDIGISIYHLKVAAEHFGKTTQIIYDKNEEKNSPKGYTYYATLKFSME